jgi:putative endonuclease
MKTVDSEVYVYIILTHYNTFYTGITNNMLRRWKEHVKGQSSYLSKFKPKEVVYTASCVNRSEAHRLEVKIKRLGALNYMNRLKYQQQQPTEKITILNTLKHGPQYRSKT